MAAGDPLSMYVFISLMAFLGIVILSFLIKKNKKYQKLSVLESLSFIFIVAGIIFGNDEIIGFSLICGGVVFIIADIYIRVREKIIFD
ncbi:hypothetical protein J4411_01160 [Candidatus Pacearchaeota archaeon]|nr:hypothetical protein [uncultured archaeon]MBS3084503.1 hypothetical protein [Candidatus Pacearchaeota archaeon]